MSATWRAGVVAVDLTNCDREPIHIPGSVQPHGLLLALTEPALRIVQVSTNALTHVGVSHVELLGRTIEDVFDFAGVAAVREALASPDPRAASPIRLTASRCRTQRTFDGILHRSGGRAVLELEPCVEPENGDLSFASFYRRVRGAVGRLQRAVRVVELCQLAADEIAALTGFDRVMAYRFDPDGHGHVIAEAKRADLESFLDLHYPASDIPAQARHLYTLNWLRLIPDVAYTPSPISPADNPLTGAPLELSFAVLRSVSPIHVEYLTNMGVRASMSVSLVVDGRLWGMLICHHYAPRFVSYEVRAACEFLGQALSWQAATRERADDFESRAASRATVTKLVEQLAAAPDVATGLAAEALALLNVVKATGAAARVGGKWAFVGETPSAGDVDALAKTLRDHLQHSGLFCTDSLVAIEPDAKRYDGIASGALVVAFAPECEDVIIWFRPEVIRTVNWAGDPHKLASLADGYARLTPRGSFALWRETVRSRALPWLSSEVEAATDLRRAIIGQVLRRNAELASRNALLEITIAERTSAVRSREELLAVVAHDLRNPLSTVLIAAKQLERLAEDRDKDQRAKKASTTISKAVSRMSHLVTNLLDLAQLAAGHSIPLDLGARDISQLVREAVKAFEAIAIARNIAFITVMPTTPLIALCDGERIEQVLANLIGNAIKFTRDGGSISMRAEVVDAAVVIAIEDTGTGIPQSEQPHIFTPYWQADPQRKGGVGLGLSIVKAIVEAHRGRLWLESTVGSGSTFYVALPTDVV